MTAVATEIGRVSWRQARWEEVLAEINNDTRFPSESTYVLLERTEHIEFTTKADAASKGVFAQHWSSGRLFNTTWELQFERTADGFLLRLLTEGDLPEGWHQAEPCQIGEEASLLLFGERKRDDDPGWREARIPRWLEYPVPKTKGRVYLVALPYCRNGMVVRMRLKGVR